MNYEICVTDIDDTRSTVAGAGAAVTIVVVFLDFDIGFSSIFLVCAMLPLSFFSCSVQFISHKAAIQNKSIIYHGDAIGNQ